MLKDMIFPLCEKLGQTIIFVRTRDSARALHHAVRLRSHPCNPFRGTTKQTLSRLSVPPSPDLSALPAELVTGESRASG